MGFPDVNRSGPPPVMPSDTTDASPPAGEGRPSAQAPPVIDVRPAPAKPSRGVFARRRRSLAADWARGERPTARDEERAAARRFQKLAPPWLVSAVLHMALVIALGLMWFSSTGDPRLDLEATWWEDLGDQLSDPVALTADDLTADEQIVTPDYLPPVDDPFAAPPAMDIQLNGEAPPVEMTAPRIGLALDGRQDGARQALLDAYGGTAQTEAAVLAALEWLARQQRPDGTWSLRGPYRDGADRENLEAATAMAVLAFAGAGNTHQQGRFQENVKRGLSALLRLQDREGNFHQGGRTHDWLYSQAQCTIAVCELYGMSKDPMLREPAQRAVDYCAAAQAALGGWRYTPRIDSDTSVTGWMVMALQSAMMAGLNVPSPTISRVSSYLDKAASDGGSRYGYQPGVDPDPVMTAEGLLCRQYLGWARDDARLVDGVEYLLRHGIDYRERDVYYWYYATQVLHHMEGEYWAAWNTTMREVLPARQEQDGPERGSWHPLGDDPDAWASRGEGGRLYVTCLSVFMLEVYYRHLPIYKTREWLTRAGGE